VRPILIIAVTSPKTRVNDVEIKVQEYAQAGVPYCAIANDWRTRGRRRLELISYWLEARKYRMAEGWAARADEQLRRQEEELRRLRETDR
jgi:Uma2 family endonuclease